MSLKNKQDWANSKFEDHKSGWRSSRLEVGIASRFNADCIARAYDRALTQYASGVLVDLGCGNAPLAGMYRHRVSKYVWADWPNSPHRIYHLDIEVDLNELLPFEDASFDTVLLSDVLEHIALPDQLIAEVSRTMKINGVAIIGVPFMYCIHEQPNDHHRYTRFKLQDFAVRNGLEILELSEYAGGIDVLQDTLTKILSFSPFSKWLAYLTHYLFSLIKMIPGLKRLNSRLAAIFPLGYIAIYRKCSK